jgi:alpha-mannosidase
VDAAYRLTGRKQEEGNHMALDAEWKRRVENWLRELPELFYTPLGSLALEGFVTKEQLTPEQALGGAFAPMPCGTRWGAKWEYAWFRGELALPAAAANERIVLKLDPGGEAVVFVNGAAAGALDREHPAITLAFEGRPGQTYSVLAEAYGGHGPAPVGEGPVAHSRESVPEPPSQQTVVGESTFGIWHEEAYQLWLDAQALYDLRNSLDAESLRVAEIDEGLRAFTCIADLELPYPAVLESLSAARARLRPLLECANGSTAPTLYTFGHAHLDVAWLWPLQETERKMARTISNQLALIAEYPTYRFLQSQPHLYYMLAKRYPELYERFCAAVKKGNIIAEGGMWVEADTNLSGGEALVRQFIHGKRFFREQFGVESELMWLPDVFGYSGALPQIMRGCGIKYFATQKIFWTYNGGDPFPYNTFTWEGIDGSTVLAHIFNDYNSLTDPGTMNTRWRQRVQKDGIRSLIVAFGWGDGGGGPTRDHVEHLLRQRDLEGAPRTCLASPVDFFRDAEAHGVPNQRYVGELYFQAHRGTYTSQARTKAGNRRSEMGLREAELWGAAAQTLRGFDIPRAALDDAWRDLLLHQFHDILPGSSIHRVYQEAEATHAHIAQVAGEAAHAAKACLTEPGQAVTAFNSLAWSRSALVPLSAGFAEAASLGGSALPIQAVNGQLLAEVELPACGWTTVADSGAPGGTAANARPTSWARAETGGPTLPGMLENELLRVRFNGKGEIVSILDKASGEELAAGPCNSFKMYRDTPNWFDAWDIDSMYEQSPVPIDDEAQLELVAEGPLVATLRLTRPLHDSLLTQDISLRRGSRRVEFATTVQWQESHKLLKVNFPVNIHANEAVHEIQFGHIRRPNHKSRPFDAARFEVCNHKWSALAEDGRGCALLNDSKYGLNVAGNSLNLTLLKSALSPDMTADKGEQRFTYAFYAWNGSLADSGVVREAYELNMPATALPGAAGERSLFAVDAPGVVIETVKPAEDGSEDIVVRLYEATHCRTRCKLTTSLPVHSAEQTDMLERAEKALECIEGKIELEFRPFEIKTIRLKI